ncbi:MAG: V-type ATPase subunit [Candidatus Methanomethylicia archaeon]
MVKVLDANTSRLGALNARVHALKSRMLKPDDFKLILKLSDLRSLLRFLGNTSYSSCLPVSEEFSTIEFDKKLVNLLIKEINIILNYLNKNDRTVFIALLNKWKHDSLRTIILSVINKIPKDIASILLLPIYPYNTDFLNYVYASSRSIEDVIHLIPEYRLRSNLLDTFNKYGPSSLFLESTILSYSYNQLFKAINNLKGIDKTLVSSIIQLDVDLSNILLILRGITLKIDPKLLESILIPSIRKHYYTPVIEMKSVDMALKILSEFHYSFLADLIGTQMNQIEYFIKKYLIKHIYRYLYGDTMNLGFPVAYLYIKHFEIMDIRTIILGVLADIPINEIINYLIIQ